MFDRCNLKKRFVKQYTMSVCKFPEEFTCKSGTCVDIFKHCDNMKDRDDGSDEEDCTMTKALNFYKLSMEAKPEPLPMDFSLPRETLM